MEMNMANPEQVGDRLGVGGNNPPADDPQNLIDVSIILPLLQQHFADLVAKSQAYSEECAEWIKNHTPDGKTMPVVAWAENEEDLNDTLDFRKQVSGFVKKRVEPARKSVKDPLDRASSIIQAFFNDKISKKLEAEMHPVDKAYTAALEARRDRDIERNLAAARIAAQRARELSEQARAAHKTADVEELVSAAEAQEDEAVRLHELANSSVAEITRLRTDFGQVGGLRITYDFEVEQIMDLIMAVVQGQAPKEYLIVNEKVVGSIVRAQKMATKIPGIRVIEIKKGR